MRIRYDFTNTGKIDIDSSPLSTNSAFHKDRFIYIRDEFIVTRVKMRGGGGVVHFKVENTTYVHVHLHIFAMNYETKNWQITRLGHT